MEYARSNGLLNLPSWLWRFSTHVKAAAERSVRYSESHIAIIGLIAAASFGLYYVFWAILQPQVYENPLLRAIGILLALPIVVAPRWPAKLRRFLPLYWCLALTYCLPFFFTFMLLMNAEFNIAQEQPSIIWPMSQVIALVFLLMLVNDAVLIGMMFIGGSAAAWGLYLGTSDTITLAAISADYLTPLPVYLFILVGGTIYNRRRETIQLEMLRAVTSVGNNVAHELRTPLLGIKANAQGLRKYLPDLVKAYELARDNSLAVPQIRARHLDSIREALDRIDNETDFSNTIIDMLLINAGGGRLGGSEMRVHSALDCVRRAIQRYPFVSEKERQLVHVSEKRDFDFLGSELLLVHVTFNLIKNALYFIAKAGKGEIYIWLESESDHNRLYIMDTGTGIHPSVMPRIFERFYTSQDAGRGSGIGLSFCQTVMDSFHGKIACESHFGEFTRFILSFPPVNKHD